MDEAMPSLALPLGSGEPAGGDDTSVARLVSVVVVPVVVVND